MTDAVSPSVSPAISPTQHRTGGWATVIDAVPRLLFLLYLVAFLAYIFVPLGVMGAATFNTSRFPTVTPWLGTTLDWFTALANDQAMRAALVTSFVVAAGVIAISLPVGTAAALVLTSLHGRATTPRFSFVGSKRR
jgi:spermidine/putrescine transport system permease protein